MTFSVKVPVVAAESLTWVTPVPPIVGLGLAVVSAYRTPRLVIETPPVLATSPPSVAVDEVMLVSVGVVIVGASMLVSANVRSEATPEALAMTL